MAGYRALVRTELKLSDTSTARYSNDRRFNVSTNETLQEPPG